jgi:hypothetical protein
MDRWSVNSELETMWKEMVVATFDVLSLHLTGGVKNNHEEL